MARTTGPVCRLCRRDGLKLFLKGSRCDSSKCAIERRDTPPGQQQSRRGKMTDYGTHLREKQKVKHYYGVLERQFRRYFAEAERSTGNTGASLMSLLERRLDNVVYRLGFGQSRAQARQMVNHGHITVNGRKVNVPSVLVTAGDVIRLKSRHESVQLARENMSENRKPIPDFLSLVDGPQPEGLVSRLPGPEDVSIPIQTQLIVELCSR